MTRVARHGPLRRAPVPMAGGAAWLVAFALAGCARPGVEARAATAERVPIVGGPCEGCEAVFEGLPERPPSVARIAPKDEPGTPMRIEGVVRDGHGDPRPGVIVYAYHTNARGIYPRGPESWPAMARRHGRLRGWATSDSLGRYAFETIRPAPYPGRDSPAHVHMHVIEPGRCTYYIDDIVFEGDPLLTAEKRRHMFRGRGGPGLTTPRADGHGGIVVSRDIVLGANVPGYPKEDE